MTSLAAWFEPSGRPAVLGSAAFLVVLALSAQAAAQAPAVTPAPSPSAPPPVSSPAPAPAPAPTADTPPATPAPGPAAAPAPAPAPAAPVIPAAAPIETKHLVSPGPTEPAEPEKVAFGTPLGKVVERRDGALVLEMDGSVKVERGMRVGFNDERGDEYAVGRVIKVNSQTFQVSVGMNEEVTVGEVGHLSEQDRTASLPAPPAAAYPLAFALVVRPWLGLNDTQSGVLLDASVRVRLGDKAKLTMAIEPAVPAFGTVSGVVEGYVAPSISLRLAEIGFGVGVGTAIASDGSPPAYGLLVSPILRVGAEDGLHLRSRSSAVLANGVATFGSFRMEGQIPLAYGLWLLLAGGGGRNSYAFGDVGVRLLLAGSGSRQSWFAKMLIGAAGGTAPLGGFPTNQGGPTFGLGIEGRL